MNTFHKHLSGILSVLSLAGLLASCTPDATDAAADQRVPVQCALSLNTRAVNSNALRIIVFNSDGICVNNTLLNLDDCTVTTNTDGSVTISKNALTLLTEVPTTCKFYAILNENGYANTLAASGKTLTKTLAAFSVGSKCYDGFQTALASSLEGGAYVMASTATKPDLVNVAYGEQEITSRQTTVNLGVDTNYGQAMAAVSVDLITDQDADGNASTTNLDLAKVFVTDLSLINVPTTRQWGETDNVPASADDVMELRFGGKNTDGYYTRSWTGTATQNYLLQQRIDLEGNMYCRTNDGKTKTEKKKIDKVEYTFTTPGWDFCEITDAHLFDQENKAKEQTPENYAAFTGFVEDRITAISASSVLISSPSGDIAITANDGWTVAPGLTAMVPEYISTSSTDCMKLRVELAIVTPSIVPAATTDWAGMFSAVSGGWGSPYYYVHGDQVPSDKFVDFMKGKVDKNVNYECHLSAEAVETTDDHGNPKTQYVEFINGISKVSTGSPTVALTKDQSSTELVWPSAGTSLQKAVFEIPVNSLGDGTGYSVERNTHYHITLQITDDAYDTLTTPSTSAPATRAAGQAGTPLKAFVTTEAINDNEE